MGPVPTMKLVGSAYGLELRGHMRVESTGEKAHWSRLGCDFPKTCSRDDGIKQTSGVHRGHRPASWFSHGK